MVVGGGLGCRGKMDDMHGAMSARWGRFANLSVLNRSAQCVCVCVRELHGGVEERGNGWHERHDEREMGALHESPVLN